MDKVLIILTTLIAAFILIINASQASAKSRHKHEHELKHSSARDDANSSSSTEERIKGYVHQMRYVQRMETDLDSIKSFINYPFSEERSETYIKENVVEFLVDKLQSYGLVVETHNYSNEYSFFASQHGVNVIAKLPESRIETQVASGRWLIIGAHYDSVERAPGVNDDGSGSAGILEVARIIARQRCRFRFGQPVFVWFDQEEVGLLGSGAFIRDIIRPKITSGEIKSVKLIQSDMILTYDPEDFSQMKFYKDSPELFESARQSNFRGDFISVIGRNTHRDRHLVEVYQASWRAMGFKPDQAKYHPIDSADLSSDQSSFWRAELELVSPLEAVVLYDNGIERTPYKNCYHKPCDDRRLLTSDNFSFMKRVLDALTMTILFLCGGLCLEVSELIEFNRK